MSKCKIIDTLPMFLTFWTEAQRKPLGAQIDGWASEYMSQWPELLQKQLEDYSSQNVDWRHIARERVFLFLGDRLPAMQIDHRNLLELCAPIYSTAQEVLGVESDVIFVIYIGIGCGAGWVTPFHNSPAVLFGLENIAECGWSQHQSIAGMVAHEIGHLMHDHWRAQYEKATGSGPWWQLYSEGFAQRCEHVILGKDTWHESIGINGDDWLDWCQDHKSWLATEFLRLVDAGESVHPFFGSWFDICGRKQCGYFLGHELIKELEASISLKEIALLDDVEEQLRHILERIAGHGT
ncbi:hypothetical protein M1O18_06415 [Dehalococcoidia bacterium]|nr:hypothetical protein [Dehalococcoidia bacterium]